MRPALAAIFVLALGGAALARKKHVEEAPAAKDALVQLTVSCATQGANVAVDGEMVGMTPMDLPVPVAPGEHTIKVTKLGFAPFIDVFATHGKREVKLEMELVPVSGVLHVKSDVAGARVMVDGRYVGDAPLDLEVDVGARAVQLSKGGYRDFFKNVLTVAGQDQDVDVRLEELPPELNPYKLPPAPPPRWYQKKWVWATLAVGGVVIAGAVTTAAILSTRGNYNVCDKADVCY